MSISSRQESRGVSFNLRKVRFWSVTVLLAAVTAGCGPKPSEPPPPEEASATPVPTATPAPGVVRLGPEELDELLAPIALYPDALIALILPAATVPSDVVMGARFARSRTLRRVPMQQRLKRKPAGWIGVTRVNGAGICVRF